MSSTDSAEVCCVGFQWAALDWIGLTLSKGRLMQLGAILVNRLSIAKRTQERYRKTG